MALIFIRTAIIFFVLLFVMRLMGKSQIGEMQPFEFVITLLIAELACIPMADTSIPLLYGIISILAIFILHQTVLLFNAWFPPIKSVVCGKPSLVINKNGIDDFQLKRNNLEISELIESMRGAGYFNLDDVYYGLYESNGSFSALPKENITQSLPLLIVESGKKNMSNMKLAGITPEAVDDFLKGLGVKLKKVLVMTVDGNGRVYFQAKGEKYKILNCKVGQKW